MIIKQIKKAGKYDQLFVYITKNSEFQVGDWVKITKIEE